MNSWQTFFDHHAAVYLQNVFTRNTLADVDFLLELLQLPAGATCLISAAASAGNRRSWRRPASQWSSTISKS